jgi:aspartyl-tRNA(Asn)/glutamyl-tRNA(Gln) amidotransferase subunit A
VAGARGLNAFVIETPEHALAAADAADAARASGDLKPLSGVPLGIKDLFATRGYQTTAGSHILGGFEPEYESTVSGNLFAAGAGMLGKLNMDEFAMGSSNETSHHGNVISPWRRSDGGNAALTPGGSSGGSAAAGGRADRAGGDRHRYRRLDPAAGRFCRNHGYQADLWPLLALGRGRLCLVARPGWADGAGRARLRDPAGSHGRLRSEGFHLARLAGAAMGGRPVGRHRGKRIGIPKEYRIEGVPAEIGRIWDQGIEWMRDAGAEIVEVSLPHTKYALPTYYIIAPAEASSNLARYDGVRYGLRERPAVEAGGGGLADMYAATRAAGFGAEVKRRIMIGTYVLSAGFYDAYFNRAQKVRALIARDFERVWAECDLLLTPTAPSAAFALGEKSDDPIAMYLNDVFAVPASLAGLPAMSVPAGPQRPGPTARPPADRPRAGRARRAECGPGAGRTRRLQGAAGGVVVGLSWLADIIQQELVVRLSNWSSKKLRRSPKLQHHAGEGRNSKRSRRRMKARK